MTSFNGKTCLVTGSTDGVGRLVATRLGEAGMRVLVHGRDHKRGEDTVAEITAGGGTALFLPADLSSLTEVRDLAARVQAETDRLYLLINNAGIGTTNPGGARQVSVDGYELRFAVNYLSGFLLTHLLLPLLKASQPARIVNVASAGQQALDFGNLMLERDYSGWRAYRQSKLAQILFTIDFAEALHGSGVTINALHPATFMDTTMVRQSGTEPMSSVKDGADAIMNLAAGEPAEGRSGLYFNGLRESKADPQAYDEEARTRLRSISQQLTGFAV